MQMLARSQSFLNVMRLFLSWTKVGPSRSCPLVQSKSCILVWDLVFLAWREKDCFCLYSSITCSTLVMLVFFSDGVRKDVTPINMQLHGEGKQEVFCWQKKLLDSFCWILKVFFFFKSASWSCKIKLADHTAYTVPLVPNVVSQNQPTIKFETVA